MNEPQYSEETILDFIRQYKAEHDWCPTVREIARGVGMNSSNTAHRYLKRLHKQGKIVYKGVRQIRVVNNESRQTISS